LKSMMGRPHTDGRTTKVGVAPNQFSAEPSQRLAEDEHEWTPELYGVLPFSQMKRLPIAKGGTVSWICGRSGRGSGSAGACRPELSSSSQPLLPASPRCRRRGGELVEWYDGERFVRVVAERNAPRARSALPTRGSASVAVDAAPRKRRQGKSMRLPPAPLLRWLVADRTRARSECRANVEQKLSCQDSPAYTGLDRSPVAAQCNLWAHDDPARLSGSAAGLTPSGAVQRRYAAEAGVRAVPSP